MNGKKMGFSTIKDGQTQAVNLRIVTGGSSGPVITLDGSVFNGCHINPSQLDQVIAILLDVRHTLGEIALAEST